MQICNWLHGATDWHGSIIEVLNVLTIRLKHHFVLSIHLLSCKMI